MSKQAREEQDVNMWKCWYMQYLENASFLLLYFDTANIALLLCPLYVLTFTSNLLVYQCKAHSTNFLISEVSANQSLSKPI